MAGYVHVRTRTANVATCSRCDPANANADVPLGRGNAVHNPPPGSGNTGALSIAGVQRRLDTISHNAEAAGQFGPAVRAEELLGKSIGMFIDRSLQLQGVLKDEHIQAVLDIARRRQAEPVDLTDTEPDA